MLLIGPLQLIRSHMQKRDEDIDSREQALKFWILRFYFTNALSLHLSYLRYDLESSSFYLIRLICLIYQQLCFVLHTKI